VNAGALRLQAATLCFIVVMGVIAACGPTAGSGPSGSSASPPPIELTVFGAASLKSVLRDVSAAYATRHPGTKLTVSTDSSATLRTQIEQGAPADIFLSADTTNPQKLVDAGLAAGPAIEFARNVLVIAVPSSNPAGIRTPADLARPGLKIIAAGEAVPITAYADKLVENLALLPDYPPAFAAAYAANVVSREDNVAAIVAKVGLGEGDVGIVYATEAKAAASVAAVEIPPSANVIAAYAGVVVGRSGERQAATTFLTWLAGPEGQAILGRFGFMPPSS
jgi:molybdate transport system substrate-binding protein